MPKFNELYRKLDKTKVAFIGVAHDNSKSLKKGIAKYKIDWPQMLSSENGNLVEKCKVAGFPTTVLLDKTGSVIAMNLRNEELEKTIEKLK